MSLVTQCPNCGTTFRAQAAQLSARGGRVRCGKCNEVFNGVAQVIEDDGAAARVGPSPQLALFDPSRLAAEAEKDAQAKAERDAAAKAAGAAYAARMRARAMNPTEDDAAFLAETPSRPHFVVLWGFLSLLALVALAAQAAIHFRTELVLLAPQIRPQLEAACDVLDCRVYLPRQPALMSIESSELRTDPKRGGIIRLTAVVRNRAPFAQEYPALELTLIDRRDEPVVRRILYPRDYLGTGDALSKRHGGIAPGAEEVVSVEFDPQGLRAAGFRLYLFYPETAPL